MFKDEFRMRYKTIPFATFSRDQHKGDIAENITSLSHKHKEVELIAILGGKARFYTDMRAYDVEKGDVLVISPYLMHNATIFAKEDFKHYCLCFDLKILPDEKLREKLEKGKTDVCPVIKSDNEIAKALTDCIVGAYNSHKCQKSGWELTVTGFMTLFFGLLSESGLIYDNLKNNGLGGICYKIIDFIDANYAENITSKDVAEAFYVSESYFCRIFKKNFGHCFHNYLCMYRIEKAKIFLDTTDLSVSEISAKTGFNSFSYFSKMFRKLTTVSPSEYRKIKQKQIV